MPLQRVVERHALADQAARGDRRAAADRAHGRPVAPPATHPGPRAAPPARPRARRCGRTSRARGARRDAGHQLRRHAHNPLARPIRNRSKEPETCRQSSSAHTRSSPSPRAQLNNARSPRRRPGRSARRAPRRSPQRPRRSCASACACPRRARSSTRRSSPLRLKWTPGGHGLLWALPRSYQVTPDDPDRRRATQRKVVRPKRADSLKESQLAAGPGPSPRRRTSPTPITTASLEAAQSDKRRSRRSCSARCQVVSSQLVRKPLQTCP